MAHETMRLRLGLPPLSSRPRGSFFLPGIYTGAVNENCRLHTPVQQRQKATDEPPKKPEARSVATCWDDWQCATADVVGNRSKNAQTPPRNYSSRSYIRAGSIESAQTQESGNSRVDRATSKQRPSSAGSSPRVLLGRLRGFWKHDTVKDDAAKQDSTSVQGTVPTVPPTEQESQQSTPRLPSLLTSAAAAMASSARAAQASCAEDSRGSEPRRSQPFQQQPSLKQTDQDAPRTGIFTRLGIRELDPVPDSNPFTAGGSGDFLGHGLLWPPCFQRYAVGCTAGMLCEGICLGVAELGRMLREHQVELDYESRCRIMELIGGKGAQAMDFNVFQELVEFTAGTATQAASQCADAIVGCQHRGNRRRKGSKSPESVALAVVRAVFNSYDFSCTGMLRREDYMRLLRDRGQTPRNQEECENLSRQLAFCREDGLPGPLNFMGFMRLLVFLNGDCPGPIN
eukprot:TRINITY_DN17608_c0_g1_i1.p1 TRINITY_DN17608_c0_g1~~TRINITY_DN17608_c0_g1_i1.p1  ORF type:complete len:456 (-),score=59.34 TRINITY_DN17608_c0_g1_i1:403-1770(-)